MHTFVVAIESDRPLFKEFLTICESVASAFAAEHNLNLQSRPVLVTSDDPNRAPSDACAIVGLGMDRIADSAARQRRPVAMLLPSKWMIDGAEDDGDWLEQLPGYYWLTDEGKKGEGWRQRLPIALDYILARALLRGYHSTFLSYGGPDEAAANQLAALLESRGVTVWWFRNDALPGQKLHRMMYDSVLRHDRVILLCSKSSLSRAGVLNEIERVLEREAREGGSDLLIPVALDDFVFEQWQPQRPDVAAQIRSRVIGRYNEVVHGRGLDKLLQALRKVASLP